MAFRNSKIILIFLQITAFWSVWQWYFVRLSASSEEVYGVVSLLAIAVICLKYGDSERGFPNLKFVIAAILLYVVTFDLLPPIFRAAVAVTSLTFSVGGIFFRRKFHFGIWILFLLGLPVINSMQFYLGYPMRIFVGETTVFLLKMNGLQVFREGAALNFAQQTVWIDAPCSGIKMLWSGFFLAALLITIYKFRFVKSVIAMLAAFGIILTGNTFRAASLFYLETGIIKMPAFAHEGIGVIVFIFTCIAIVLTILKLKNRSSKLPEAETTSIEKPFSPIKAESLIFASACFLALITPIFFAAGNPVKINREEIAFPTHFESKPLQRLDLAEHEQFFLSDFPGEMRRFTDGKREIIIRYVTHATGKLHPSSICFNAIGYEIAPLPMKKDENGQKWSCFNAKRKNENLSVCERIYTESNESWTDVSSWYWSNLGKSTASGFWAMTVAESAKGL